MSRPVMIGLIAGLALIVAFIAGSALDFNGGGPTLDVDVGAQGPMEKAGEAIDDAVNKAE